MADETQNAQSIISFIPVPGYTAVQPNGLMVRLDQLDGFAIQQRDVAEKQQEAYLANQKVQFIFTINYNYLRSCGYSKQMAADFTMAQISQNSFPMVMWGVKILSSGEPAGDLVNVGPFVARPFQA